MPVTINFRNIKQENFSLELNEDATIGEVKAAIRAEKGEEYPVEMQKLIYDGKILADTTKVSEIGFNAAKFCVVIVCKKSPPPPAAVEGAGSAPPAVPAPAAAADALTPEQEASVAAIMELGSDRENALAVLRASAWNRDRAAGFLFMGIPGDVNPEAPRDAAPANPPAEDAGDAGEAGDAVDEAQEHRDLDILANLPQLDEIRRLVQANPENLAPILQEIAAHNPRLVRTIQNNQQEFMDMLNGAGDYDQRHGGAGAGAAGAGDGQGGRRRVVHLNQDQLDAINRIKGIVNASEATVVEAYFACDQDEEAAINFIFNNMDD